MRANDRACVIQLAGDLTARVIRLIIPPPLETATDADWQTYRELVSSEAVNLAEEIITEVDGRIEAGTSRLLNRSGFADRLRAWNGLPIRPRST